MALIPGVIASGKLGHLNNNNFFSIATATVGSGGSSSVSFTSIPQTYTHLQLRCIMQINANAINPLMSFNGDTGNNYTWQQGYGDGSGSSGLGASASTAQPGIGLQYTSTQWGYIIIDIMDYTSGKLKSMKSMGGTDKNGSGHVGINGGLWNNSSAINAISISSTTQSWVQYSQFALYGVK